jgi:hypothetical protein
MYDSHTTFLKERELIVKEVEKESEDSDLLEYDAVSSCESFKHFTRNLCSSLQENPTAIYSEMSVTVYQSTNSRVQEEFSLH